MTVHHVAALPCKHGSRRDGKLVMSARGKLDGLPEEPHAGQCSSDQDHASRTSIAGRVGGPFSKGTGPVKAEHLMKLAALLATSWKDMGLCTG